MVSFQLITLLFLLVSGALFAYLIPCGAAYLRKHHLPVTRDSDRDGQQNHGTSAYHHHAEVRESHAGQNRQGHGLPERCHRRQVLLVGHRHNPVTDTERLQPEESKSEQEAKGVYDQSDGGIGHAEHIQTFVLYQPPEDKEERQMPRHGTCHP